MRYLFDAGFTLTAYTANPLASLVCIVFIHIFACKDDFRLLFGAFSGALVATALGSSRNWTPQRPPYSFVWGVLLVYINTFLLPQTGEPVYTWIILPTIRISMDFIIMTDMDVFMSKILVMKVIGFVFMFSFSTIEAQIHTIMLSGGILAVFLFFYGNKI